MYLTVIATKKKRNLMSRLKLSPPFYISPRPVSSLMYVYGQISEDI